MLESKWEERLTKVEITLVQTPPGWLDQRSSDDRAAILQREVGTDIRWGFFDTGLFPSLRRLIYVFCIHRFRRKPWVARVKN